VRQRHISGIRAAGAEEITEQGGAFVSADAAIGFELMIEAGIAAQIEDRAGIRLGSASGYCRDPRFGQIVGTACYCAASPFGASRRISATLL
jgi:hypothetical protein